MTFLHHFPVTYVLSDKQNKRKLHKKLSCPEITLIFIILMQLYRQYLRFWLERYEEKYKLDTIKFKHSKTLPSTILLDVHNNTLGRCKYLWMIRTKTAVNLLWLCLLMELYLITFTQINVEMAVTTAKSTHPNNCIFQQHLYTRQ